MTFLDIPAPLGIDLDLSALPIRARRFIFLAGKTVTLNVRRGSIFLHTFRAEILAGIAVAAMLQIAQGTGLL